jgi:hypothetical protein
LRSDIGVTASDVVLGIFERPERIAKAVGQFAFGCQLSDVPSSAHPVDNYLDGLDLVNAVSAVRRTVDSRAVQAVHDLAKLRGGVCGHGSSLPYSGRQVKSYFPVDS